MSNRLNRLGKDFSTFLLAFALAIAVWISAVTAADPTEQRVYPAPIAIETVGLDPGVVLVNDLPTQVNLTLSAPKSIWNLLLNDRSLIRAVVDLSGKNAGRHELPIQVQISVNPVRVVSTSPSELAIILDNIANRDMAVTLEQKGEPSIGFQAEMPTLDQDSVIISGPKSIVDKASQVRAVLDLNNASEDISRSLPLTVLDANGLPLNSLTVTPAEVEVNMIISRRGGYRNVVVKVVPTGQVASGYRVTNISVYPPTLPVYSSEPILVDQLPGYVETAALNLNGAKEDISVSLPLSLPSGVSVVGKQTVDVQVSVDSIEGSLTLSGMKVEVIGVNKDLIASISPATVDVILSGPMPMLDALRTSNIRVLVDLTNTIEGTYQRVPSVEINNPDVDVKSILPESVEITLKSTSPTTATPSATP